jgi:16S rRNA (uracil1498-N3)-methyltransferase
MSMGLPYFYMPVLDPSRELITLEENSSRHAVQVLRMQAGELMQLADGRGNLLTVQIESAHKKHCLVKTVGSTYQPADRRQIVVAMALLKNTQRFEWFLEKATEIGIAVIIPLICDRTEKKQFRSQRSEAVLVSAMIQSKQVWLPDLKEPMTFVDLIKSCSQAQKFIAHCHADSKTSLRDAINRDSDSQIILIGPEGDFSSEEINLALNFKFMPVSLGKTRLRSETSGVVAASLLKLL